MKFLNAESDFDQAQKVILGIPFDGSVSFRAGAAKAPTAIRSCSDSLETYSPYQNKDLDDYKIHDTGDLILSSKSFPEWSEAITQKVTALLQNNKLPYCIGGDHSITYPILQAIAEFHAKPFSIVQLDAHCDLRSQYENNPFSHACVMHNAAQLEQVQNIYQIGIRSGTKQEFEEAHILEINGTLAKKISKIQGPVYLTIDIDFFDPAFVPGTGTPEPGGYSFADFIKIFKHLKNLEIIGFDLVELAPTWDPSNCSAVFAAKIMRELLLYTTL